MVAPLKSKRLAILTSIRKSYSGNESVIDLMGLLRKIEINTERRKKMKKANEAYLSLVSCHG
jgi:hypothetical protein